MPPARYANAPIALISLNYNLNYERAYIFTRSSQITTIETNARQSYGSSSSLVETTAVWWWEIHNFQRSVNLKLITKGPVPSERELKIAELVGDRDNRALCSQQDRVISCQNFKTEAKEPGKYTFELKVLDRDSKVVATQTTEEVEIVAKPEPEVKDFKSDKSTYNSGEKVLLDFAVQYLEKLTASEIFTQAKDGKIENRNPIYSDGLTKNTYCKVEAQKMQLVCRSLPIDLAQAGTYQIEVTTVSKSKKQTLTPPPVTIELLPKKAKIVSFTLNKSITKAVVVREGETLTMSWQVDGENNIQVELNPFGTVEKSGTKQIPVNSALPSQISLIVTDTDGKKFKDGFSIKVEANSTPNNTPSVPVDRPKSSVLLFPF